MTIREVTMEEALLFEKSVHALFKDEPTKLEQDFTKQLVKQMSMLGFWGAKVWVLEVDGKAVSINATRFSKGRSHDAWGKYSSFYLAYTLPSHRYRGYATRLQRAVEEQSGMDRLRSLAGSWGGFRLHYRMGHEFWGIAERGEVLIDTPISSAPFPTGVPKRARKFNTTGTRLSREALIEVLTGERFGRTVPEVEEYLSDYGDGSSHHRTGNSGVGSSAQSA